MNITYREYTFWDCTQDEVEAWDAHPDIIIVKAKRKPNNLFDGVIRKIVR